MSKQARELAELMGWTDFEKVGTGYWCSPPQSIDLKKRPLPAYDTDRNAMAEVHKVRHEQGLWGKFLRRWDNYSGPHSDAMLYKRVYFLLNDPEGQVQAAIQVLKEAK